MGSITLVYNGPRCSFHQTFRDVQKGKEKIQERERGMEGESHFYVGLLGQFRIAAIRAVFEGDEGFACLNDCW